MKQFLSIFFLFAFISIGFANTGLSPGSEEGLVQTEITKEIKFVDADQFIQELVESDNLILMVRDDGYKDFSITVDKQITALGIQKSTDAVNKLPFIEGSHSYPYFVLFESNCMVKSDIKISKSKRNFIYNKLIAYNNPETPFNRLFYCRNNC